MYRSRLATAACGALLLAACGTKTPLELPPQPPATSPAAAPANTSTGATRP